MDASKWTLENEKGHAMPGIKNCLELKPCPCCGKEAKMHKFWAIKCNKCGLNTARFDDRENAIAAWNRRAPEPVPPLMAVDPVTGSVTPVVEPGTSVIRWTTYNGTPGTLPMEHELLLVSRKEGDVDRAYLTDDTWTLNYMEEHEVIIGDQWAYFPEPPEESK